jgi:hypothetical protein
LQTVPRVDCTDDVVEAVEGGYAPIQNTTVTSSACHGKVIINSRGMAKNIPGYSYHDVEATKTHRKDIKSTMR